MAAAGEKVDTLVVAVVVVAAAAAVVVVVVAVVPCLEYEYKKTNPFVSKSFCWNGLFMSFVVAS